MADIEPTVPGASIHVPKSYLEENFQAIKDRINTLPDSSYTTGRHVRIGVAGAVAGGDVDMAGDKLKGYSTELGDTDITADITISSANFTTYSGATILCGSSSAITITIAATVPDGWSLHLVQDLGAGVITLAGSSLTLRHPSSHTKISARYGVVMLQRVGSSLYLRGDTAA